MHFDPTRLAFLALAAIAVVAAYRVVTTPRIMHAALWLGLTFIMLAGVFLVMGAEFLAAAQVLIYVGAVTTIILFGIMLSEAAEIRGRAADDDEAAAAVEPSQTAPRPRGLIRQTIIPIVAVVAFAGVLIFAYASVPWPDTPAGFEDDTVSIIGRALFTDFVVPFELAAVLLLIALVGAIVIAVRDDEKKERGET